MSVFVSDVLCGDRDTFSNGIGIDEPVHYALAVSRSNLCGYRTGD